MKRLISLMFAITLIHCSCKPIADRSYTIYLDNKSNQIIYLYGAYILPDTMLSLDKPKLIEIEPGKFKELYDHDVNDPGLERLETEKLTIFVLNKDTVDRNTWNYIRVNYKILKRYEVTEKDIINMGGSVSYP